MAWVSKGLLLAPRLAEPTAAAVVGVAASRESGALPRLFWAEGVAGLLVVEALLDESLIGANGSHCDADVGGLPAVVDTAEAVADDVGLPQRYVQDLSQTVHRDEQLGGFRWLPMLVVLRQDHHRWFAGSRGMSLTQASSEP